MDFSDLTDGIILLISGGIIVLLDAGYYYRIFLVRKMSVKIK